jgi:hydroxymethylpyrimidine kinase/phosphomethylpyrimidine kinase
MTRQPAPADPPVVCAIAGSDSGGGAGIQADVKTIEAGGGFATTAVTSVTAQHTRGVEHTEVLPVDAVRAQLEAVRGDFDLGALKTGMLATTPLVELVTEHVTDSDAPAVVDPVMVAASGDRLLESAAEDAYEALIAEATLVTPNADEAAVLTDVDPETPAEAAEAGETLVGMGAEAALVKGGHIPGEDVVDVLVTADTVETFRHERIDTAATHGSGCTLSSAVATSLAQGDDVPTAVADGIDLLSRAVRYHLDVGQGPGAVHHLVRTRDRAARQPTGERVAELVHNLERRDVRALVPEVGMNVVAATPYAELPSECAAVEGRITRTLDGVRANGGVRFGASSHVARFLLEAREHVPALRYAVNCRFDADVEAALDALDGAVGEYDRDAEPEAVAAEEGSTMQWGSRQVFGAASGVADAPVAVIDRGAVGKEAIVKLVAAESATLLDRIDTLDDAVRD